MHECYCMAYDKEAGAQKKMEQAADQMAEAAIKGEDAQSFAEEYQAQKSNRRRYEKIMQQLDKIEKWYGDMYEFAEAEVKYNTFNGRFYIYARMRAKGAKKEDEHAIRKKE